MAILHALDGAQAALKTDRVGLRGGTMPRSIMAIRSRISISRTRPLAIVETIATVMPPTIATIGIRNGEINPEPNGKSMMPPGNAQLHQLDRVRPPIVSGRV